MSSQDIAAAAEAGQAPGWKPEEGDLLVGTVVGLSRGWSDYLNGFYPIVTISPDQEQSRPYPIHSDSEEGQPVAVHCFQYVLMDRMTALRPESGELIAIKMGPKIPTKDGKRSVQTYTVSMNRDEDIWGDIASPRTQQPQVGRQTQLSVTDVTSDDDMPF